jgi:hypothetical protein
MIRHELNTALIEAAHAMVPSRNESDLVNAVVEILEQIEIAKFGRSAATQGELAEVYGNTTREEVKQAVVAARRARITVVSKLNERRVSEGLKRDEHSPTVVIFHPQN